MEVLDLDDISPGDVNILTPKTLNSLAPEVLVAMEVKIEKFLMDVCTNFSVTVSEILLKFLCAPAEGFAFKGLSVQPESINGDLCIRIQIAGLNTPTGEFLSMQQIIELLRINGVIFEDRFDESGDFEFIAEDCFDEDGDSDENGYSEFFLEDLVVDFSVEDQELRKFCSFYAELSAIKKRIGYIVKLNSGSKANGSGDVYVN